MNTSAVITLDHTIVKSDNFVESTIDGEAVIMNLDEGSFSSMVGTGFSIWTMIDQPRRVADICAELLAQFDVEKAECEEQTITFLQGLKEKGFIQVS